MGYSGEIHYDWGIDVLLLGGRFFNKSKVVMRDTGDVVGYNASMVVQSRPPNVRHPHCMASNSMVCGVCFRFGDEIDGIGNQPANTNKIYCRYHGDSVLGIPTTDGEISTKNIGIL